MFHNNNQTISCLFPRVLLITQISAPTAPKRATRHSAEHDPCPQGNTFTEFPTELYRCSSTSNDYFISFSMCFTYYPRFPSSCHKAYFPSCLVCVACYSTVWSTTALNKDLNNIFIYSGHMVLWHHSTVMSVHTFLHPQRKSHHGYLIPQTN